MEAYFVHATTGKEATVQFMETEREFTISELAQLFGRNEETVRRWRIRGRNGVKLAIPSANDHPGRRGYLIPASAVRAFLEKNPTLTTVAIAQALADGDSATEAEPSPKSESSQLGAGALFSAPSAVAIPPLFGGVMGGIADVLARKHMNASATITKEAAIAEAAAPDASSIDSQETDNEEPSFDRTSVVMRGLLAEKLSRREELLLELKHVEEEIAVLTTLSEDASRTT